MKTNLGALLQPHRLLDSSPAHGTLDSVTGRGLARTTPSTSGLGGDCETREGPGRWRGDVVGSRFVSRNGGSASVERNDDSGGGGREERLEVEG